MDQEKKLHPGIAALIVIVLIGIVASVVVVVNQHDGTKNTTTSDTNQSSTPTGSSSATSTDTSTYKDGSYTATGSYVTPGGTESIDLTVTIGGGVITDAQLSQNATGGDAQQYQSAFASGYKSLVVGKKVGQVSLSRVAGSSLTSNGFNKALQHIKDDAKAS